MKRYLFVLLAMSLVDAKAQDAIAASKEPLHKNVFENKYVRVLELHIAPGDTTLMHKHEKPVVSISLHPVKTGSQTILDDKGAKVPSTDRAITFEGFYQSPRIHRVWNRDTSMFHWMDIEVLTKGEQKIDSLITMDGFTQAFDAPPVRAYRVRLKGNQQFELKRNNALLIVGLTNAGDVLVNKKPFNKQADFLFVEPSKKIKFANKQDQEYSFAVLEMK
jgi:hypothetical protein